MRGRHKSLDKHVKRSINWVERLPGVTKVILGFSENCRHKYAPGHIKFKMNVSGGIKVNAYSGSGVTDIFIRIDPIELREQVVTKIAQRFVGGG